MSLCSLQLVHAVCPRAAGGGAGRAAGAEPNGYEPGAGAALEQAGHTGQGAIRGTSQATATIYLGSNHLTKCLSFLVL